MYFKKSILRLIALHCKTSITNNKQGFLSHIRGTVNKFSDCAFRNNFNLIILILLTERTLKLGPDDYYKVVMYAKYIVSNGPLWSTHYKGQEIILNELTFK